jgi:FAD/FMN-containing dehydrogenase
LPHAFETSAARTEPHRPFVTVLRHERRYLAWGRAHNFVHRVARPAFTGDLLPLLHAATTDGRHVLGYGMGRSYGDSCLNGGHGLIDMRGLDRFIAFDRETGVIEVEAGVTLADILRVLGAGEGLDGRWFLPVTPGTKFVSVGGAIANDVHGKNHHGAGCFGNHLLSFRLLRSDGATLECSSTQNAELFAATIGGLGLTGLILSARIQLKPVPSLWLECETIRYDNLDAFYELSAESEAAWEYTVAWIDCLARGKRLGRGVFSRARHTHIPASPPRTRPSALEPRLSVPMGTPGIVLNTYSISAFNAVYWRRAPARALCRVVSFDPVLYPLDAIGRWSYLYGPRGFYQYQCVVPMVTARDAIRELAETVAAARDASFLTVLKTFGKRASPGMLSFPMHGVTMAVDIPNKGERTRELLDRLDNITTQAGGRTYPAKDGRVSAEWFQAGYPGWRDFARHVDPQFSSTFWRRVSSPIGRDSFV